MSCMRASDKRKDPISYSQPSQSQPSYRHKPKPQRDMYFGNKSSSSSAYSSSWYRSRPTPQQPSYSSYQRQRQPQSRDTLTTLFPGPSSEALYGDLKNRYQLPAPAPARVSLTSIPHDNLPPRHRQQPDAIYFEPRGYTRATQPQPRQRQPRQEKDSWHTLRQAPRPRIIEVEELGGRFVPEAKLGRYL